MALKRGSVLKELRHLMTSEAFVGTPLQAYIIPSGDAHQSEYLAACDKRRSFISGFTGSAGMAIVTTDHACMWTDGRYFLQASQEMDENWTLMKEGVPSTPTQGAWLLKTLNPGSRVGFDPYLMPYSTYRPLQTQLEGAGHSLVPIPKNLVDPIWGSEQPKRPLSPAVPLPSKFTGVTSSSKVDAMRLQMTEKGTSQLVITALDQVAWLLNLRGSDIPYNPVFFAYVVLDHVKVNLFIDEAKVTSSVKEHFKSEGLNITIQPYEAIEHYLKNQIPSKRAGQPDTNSSIWISENSSYALCSLVPESLLVSEVTPVAIMKTVKNEVETQGMINSHIRDAAALCCYFAWLEKELAKGNVVTEITGATRLEQFRKEQDLYVGLSFETISSVGPNAAIIHYSPHPDTDRPITDRDFYLCDSGGQYMDGTTDVTRTIHLGQASQYERECFTRVFKGQYALRASVFPTKIKGNCLDTLARKPLWDVGLDYMHGTGHGIGSYLNVHEGPIGISWRTMPDDPGMEADMFLSNEPGYYEDGKFGIRLENIVRTVPAKTPYNFKDRGFLTFEDVTVVPVQTRLLVREMLSRAEVEYLNAYHVTCRSKVGPLLEKQERHEALQWLERETQPLPVPA